MAWSGKASVWVGISPKGIPKHDETCKRFSRGNVCEKRGGGIADRDVGVVRPVKGERKERLGRKSLRSWHRCEKVLARSVGSPPATGVYYRDGPALYP